MSYDYLDLVLPFTGLAHGPKHVLITIAGFANNKTHVCFPSLKSIGDRCGLSENSVIKQVKYLESEGYIDITKRFKKTKNGNVRSDSSIYKVKFYSDLPAVDTSLSVDKSSNLPQKLREGSSKIEGGVPQKLREGSSKTEGGFLKNCGVTKNLTKNLTGGGPPPPILDENLKDKGHLISRLIEKPNAGKLEVRKPVFAINDDWKPNTEVVKSLCQKYNVPAELVCDYTLAKFIAFQKGLKTTKIQNQCGWNNSYANDIETGFKHGKYIVPNRIEPSDKPPASDEEQELMTRIRRVSHVIENDKNMIKAGIDVKTRSERLAILEADKAIFKEQLQAMQGSDRSRVSV